MALDVYLGRQEDGTIIAQFEADGYYFYLYPLFEDLKKTTNQMIDLYDDAIFEGNSLNALAETFKKARAMVEREPLEWKVRVGWTDTSKRIEIKKMVRRDTFKELLNQLESSVAAAIANGQPVVFLGD